ncbi:MAG TPA: heavy metal translocating P-type ATPase [Aquificaceae bacterium]|nr:heavy metal translocating P-type ATPase [Aquificaceae bacterium]QWK12576.1 MAG: heavy metal translocating P-type ATPase [Aquificota bacterium]HCO39558.1 heavy metal translocating P-type ATPase [Aquificaceae bacterium]
MHHHAHHEHEHKHTTATSHEMHLFEIRKKAIVCTLLSVPVVLLSPAFQELLGFSLPEFYGRDLIILVLSSLVFLYGGSFFIKGSLEELKILKPGMMSLVSVAISVGFAYSFYAHFSGGMDFFWELSTLVVVMLWGHFIEMKSVLGASRALEELAKLIPKKARLVKGDELVEVDTAKLRVGDVVLVKVGEKVPADGTVIEGNAHVDESLLTGESIPVFKKEGDKVIAGSISLDGVIKVRVERTGEASYLSQVMRIVKEAQESKTRLQNLADRVAFYLTIIAILVGLGTFFIWVYFSKDVGFAMERAVSVVVITCPHALGLAIPLVIAISTSYASSKGILVRDRLSLELLRKVYVVLFDKTGTLTEGKFGLRDVYVKDMDEEEFLKLVASIEINSEHIIGRAIVQYAKTKGIDLEPVEEFKVYPGKGVLGKVRGMSVAVGTEGFLKELGMAMDEDIVKKAQELSKQGKTVIWVGIEGRLRGILALSDSIRKESYEAIKSIKAMRKKVMMITGDSEEVAGWVSRELGIDEYFSRVLPHQKSEKVKELQGKGLKVAMVGDGINDAPALMQADVGIAIGSGTDVAIESAGIILVKNDPRDVVRAIRLSSLTYTKMVQNLFWATAYNLFAIPLAAGVFYKWGLLLPLPLSALLMSMSTLVVSINALLMRRHMR